MGEPVPLGIKINCAIRLPLGMVQGGNGVHAIILISLLLSESITPGNTKSPDRVVEDLPSNNACVSGGRGPEIFVDNR